MKVGLRVISRSQQLAKLINRETGIAHNTAESESVDGVVARDRQNTRAIRHDDMLTLTNDRETCLLQSAHCIEVIDPRDLRQG